MCRSFLEHHGIKGMKWGQRKRSRSSGHPEHDDAPEHTRARELHSVAKAKGTRKLTNKDLEDLNKRLNLEQNYANLNVKTKQKSAAATGAKWLGGKVLKVGDMALDEITKAHVRVQLIEKGLVPVAKKDK